MVFASRLMLLQRRLISLCACVGQPPTHTAAHIHTCTVLRGGIRATGFYSWVIHTRKWGFLLCLLLRDDWSPKAVDSRQRPTNVVSCCAHVCLVAGRASFGHLSCCVLSTRKVVCRQWVFVFWCQQLKCQVSMHAARTCH